MKYPNRMMSSQGGEKDGHPSGGQCPNDGAPLYYARSLQLHDRTLEDVEYCSGGCGFNRPAERDRFAVAELPKDSQ